MALSGCAHETSDTLGRFAPSPLYALRFMGGRHLRCGTAGAARPLLAVSGCGVRQFSVKLAYAPLLISAGSYSFLNKRLRFLAE